MYTRFRGGTHNNKGRGLAQLIRKLSLLLVSLVLFFGSLKARCASVTLAWNPSPSQGVTGYNICYGPSTHNYTNIVDVGNSTSFCLFGLIFVQVIFVTMVYGPIAAYLVEAFPAKIRYTSVSLPYHIGNGVFGGLVPLIGLYSCEATGNIYAGLWYPMIVASITFVVGSLLLRDTKGVQIWREVAAASPPSGGVRR